MSRTRNHILEDISLASLKLLMPEYVIHEYSKNDYGIDIQIELFSSNGERTGLRCYGQLKATDLDETCDLLRIDRKHFEYWSRHTDPVILFRYFDKSKTFKWCWLHEIEWRLKNDKKTLNVSPFLRKFERDNSYIEIEQYLHLREDILHSKLILPYKVLNFRT